MKKYVIDVIENIDKKAGNDVTFEETMEFLEEVAELHNSGENETKTADNRQTANSVTREVRT